MIKLNKGYFLLLIIIGVIHIVSAERIKTEKIGYDWNKVKLSGIEQQYFSFVVNGSQACIYPKNPNMKWSDYQGLNLRAYSGLKGVISDKTLFLTISKTGGGANTIINYACLSINPITGDYVRFGNSSAVAVYEAEQKVVFSLDNQNNITATLYKNIDGDWNNSVNSIFVRIDNQTYKFGADDNYSTGWEQYKYIIHGDSFLGDDYTYISGDYAYKINLNDICKKEAQCNITRNNNDLEIIFWSNGTIDPTITISSVSTTDRLTNASYEAQVRTPFEHTTANVTAYWNFDNDIDRNAWTTGNTSSALKFNGINEYLNLGTGSTAPLLNMTYDFTISSWVKTNYSGYQTIIAWDSTSGQRRSWQLGYQTGGQPYCYVRLNTTDYQINSLKLIPDNKWHQVVCVKDSTNQSLKIYIDGVLNNTASGPIYALALNNSLISTDNVIVGAITGGGAFYWNGTIDELKVWNRSLSASEISNLYNNETIGQRVWNSTGLNLDLRFENNTFDNTVNLYHGSMVGFGTTAYDMSSNNYDLTYSAYAMNNPSNGLYSDGVTLDDAKGKTQTGVSASITNLANQNYPITVNTWVKVNNEYYGASGNDAGIIGFQTRKWGISYGGSISGEWGLGFYAYNSSGSTNYKFSGYTPTFNTWYMVTGIYNGTDVMLYINGTYIGKTSLTGSMPTGVGTFYLGYGRTIYNTLLTLNGSLDDVTIFPRQLSDSEITNLYNNQSTRFYPTATSEPLKIIQVNRSINTANISYSDFDSFIDSNLSGLIYTWNLANGYVSSFQSVADVWHLDSSYKDSVGSYDMTTNNGQPTNSSGIFNNSMAFSGVAGTYGVINSVMTTAYGDASQCSNPFTWSMWVNTSTFPSGLIRNGDPTQKWGYQIWIDSSNNLHVGIGTGSQGTCGGVPNDGQWHYIAVEYNSNNIYCSVDGNTLQNLPFYCINGTGGNNVNVGYATDDTGTDRYLVGKLDEIHFYNLALTQSQIGTDYLSTLNWTFGGQANITNKNTNYQINFTSGQEVIRPATQLQSNGFYSPYQFGSINLTYDIYSSPAATINGTVPTVNQTLMIPPNNTAYLKGRTFDFRANITDLNGTNVSSVYINISGTMYSAYILSGNNMSGIWRALPKDFGVGTYSYCWFANDTLNNINNSVCSSFSVSKATPNLNFSINLQSPQTYGTAITPTCNSTTGDITPTLTNGTNLVSEILGAGTWLLNCSMPSTQNFTAISNYSYFTINQATPSLNLVATTPITYGTTTDFTGSGCPSELICSLNISNGVYGAGTINANYSTIGNNNYSAESAFFGITINQASSSVYTFINNTRSNKNYRIGVGSIWLNGTLITGQYNGGINLTINGTQLNYSNTNNISYYYNFSSLGTFNINITYYGNQNYSASNELWQVIISSIPSQGNGTASQCRYRKFGYYNENLPWFREVNCI